MSKMKKKTLISLMALMLVLSTVLCGCNKIDYDFEGEDLSAYITLPADLKTRDFSQGLSLKALPTDEDVQKEIDKVLEKLAEPVDLDENAVVEDGDSLVMDYVGKLNGEAFEGGTATDSTHTVDIENSTFIDGFDKGLLGMKVGETKDLELTFPNPYPNNPDLAGKDVVFTVTVDSIERVKAPELTDELVAANPEEFESMATAAEYREHVKEHLTEEADSTNDKKLINAAWDYVLKNSTFIKYPDGLLDKYVDRYLDYYEHTVAANKNQHLKAYVKDQGYESVAAFTEAVVKPEAETALKERIALYAVAKLMEVTVTEEEVKAQAETYYKENIEPSIQFYSAYLGISSFNDYYKQVKDSPDMKESMLFDRAFAKLTGVEIK